MRRIQLSGALVFVLAACSEPTGNRESESAVVVEHLIPLRGVGMRDSDAPDLPAIRIVDARNGTAVAGRGVVFTFEAPGEANSTMSLVSDCEGIARVPRWRLVLYQSGVFNRFVNKPAAAFEADEWRVGTYKLTGPATIELYLPCNDDASRCFPQKLEAMLHDGEMIIDHSEGSHPWIERYVLR